MSLPVALQLYTVREYTKDNFIGTLEKVAEIGYKGVEFAGFGEIKASEMKAVLDRLGLKASGSHTPLDLLNNNLDYVIEYNLEIGNSYISCPFAKYEGKDDFIKMAELLNKIGEKCNKHGITFCYHNHAHEFANFDGTYGLDMLYNLTNPAYLQTEIDTFWVTRAGIDPVGYLKKYPGRSPLVHIKDMEAGTNDFAEIGNGIIDIKAIAEASIEVGAKWLIVEQDRCKRPAIESAKISFENLKRMGLA